MMGVTPQQAAESATRRGADIIGNRPFCLVLKVVNSAAYGPDVTELVADVTQAARTPAAAVA